MLTLHKDAVRSAGLMLQQGIAVAATVCGSDWSEHEVRAAAYGRGREAATGGSRFATRTAVAAAKRSKAESTTAPSGAGPP